MLPLQPYTYYVCMYVRTYVPLCIYTSVQSTAWYSNSTLCSAVLTTSLSLSLHSMPLLCPSHLPPVCLRYQTVYQLGVFLSRSSVNIIAVRHVWIFAVLQVRFPLHIRIYIRTYTLNYLRVLLYRWLCVCVCVCVCVRALYRISFVAFPSRLLTLSSSSAWLCTSSCHPFGS